MEDLEPQRARLRAVAAERLSLRPLDLAMFDAEASAGALDHDLYMLAVTTSAVTVALGYGPPESAFVGIVDRWAARRKPIKALPPATVILPTSIEPQAEPVAADPAPGDSAGQRKKWTPERLEELRAHRAKHGTAAAAKWAGISTTRVRELLPGDKPRPRGFSAFSQGAK